MTVTNKQFSIWAASMVTALATALAAVSATQAGSDTLRCDIAAAPSSGIGAIESLAPAGYGFSTIRQDGSFDALAAKAAMRDATVECVGQIAVRP